ncbi:MAG: SDR family oxidoreductase [bacterium]|nr:SDR family oxidoreductase [bacterium]
MPVSVKDSVVLVTGANRGIGRAIVDEAFERGASKVYAAVRDMDSTNPLKEQYGDKLVALQLDLLDHNSIRAAAQAARDVTIVINNAGVLRTASPLSETAIEDMQYEMNVNVYGLIEMARAFAPVLASNGGGAFAQLNSVASLKSFADFATYSASKAASYSITQALRDKLAEQGTEVISVHPGPIQTDMAQDAGLGDIAEPPGLVAAAIFDAMENGDFHAWPDSMAKQFGQSYSGFAREVIEADVSESPN